MISSFLSWCGVIGFLGTLVSAISLLLDRRDARRVMEGAPNHVPMRVLPTKDDFASEKHEIKIDFLHTLGVIIILHLLFALLVQGFPGLFSAIMFWVILWGLPLLLEFLMTRGTRHTLCGRIAARSAGVAGFFLAPCIHCLFFT
jgi:hypothetical protein